MYEIVGEIPDKEVFKDIMRVTKEDCERIQKSRQRIEEELHSKESTLRIKKMFMNI